MIRKLNSLLCAALLLATFASVVRAERRWVGWNPEDGAIVRQGFHVEWYRGGEGRYIGTNPGEAAFVWSDTRGGDRGVYLQVVGTNLELKFEDNGVKITDAVNRQEDPQVWPSNDGGWYVGWEDFDQDSLGDIYCTKVDANGERVEGWGGEEGRAVCRFEGEQLDIRIVDDLQGGCIIVWIDKRGGDTANLYGMHILANGQPDPEWPANGKPIVSAQGAQNGHTADADGEGGMILGWRDGRAAGNFDIWAQRITPAGELPWGNGQGIQVCAHGSNQDSPKVCPDGAGGAFFAWIDDRNIQASNKDVFAQRVNHDGQLLWPAAGQAVCTEVEEQTEVRIVNSSAGEAIITWEDKRADGLTYDIYAMRVSGENQLRKEWDPSNGVPVVVEERNQMQVRLYPDGQGGAYFVWEDERDAGFPEVDIWAQRMNRNGQPVWEQNGIPICQAPDNQHSPFVRRTANGGAAICWGDYRSGSQEVWTQRVSPEGQLGWQEDGIPLVAGIGGNAIGPKVIYRGDGWVTTYWVDGRFGGNGTIPYIQNIRNNNGEIEYMYPQDGLPVIRGTRGGAINAAATFGNNGSTIVVWEDHRVGDIYSIYAQRVASNGELLWGESGIKVADYGYEQTVPYVVYDGSGGAFVGWRAPNDNGDNDVFLQHIDQDGRRDQRWGESGIVLAGTAADEQIEEMISDEENGLVVCWLKSVLDEETFQWDDNIWAERLDAQGNRMWDDGEGGHPVVDFMGRQRECDVVRDHQLGYMFVWVDGRDDDGTDDPGNDIYGQFILPDGEDAWLRNGLILVSEIQHQDNPSVEVNWTGHVWLVWEDGRNTGIGNLHRDVYMNKFYPIFEGNSVPFHFDFNGHILSSEGYNQIKPVVIHDGQGGVYVSWEDYRNGGVWSDVYATHLRPNGRPYPLWEVNGNMISGAYHKQESVSLALLTPLGEGGAVVAWDDKRSTGKEELSNVYVQRIVQDPVAVEDESAPVIPKSFAIESIHPNPFNPGTILTFSVVRDSRVEIGLYDLTGRLVLDLGNDNWIAGHHKVALNGGSLAAGSYIVRLKSEGETTEQRIQLIK